MATPCVEIWQTSNLRRLRLGEERKKEERKKKPHGKNIMSASATQGGHNKNVLAFLFLNVFVFFFSTTKSQKYCMSKTL